MTLDTKARALALSLLTKFGKACTLKQVTEGTYDTDTGLVSNTTTPYSIMAYLEAPNKQDLAGGQIVTTDEVAIFAASGLAVSPQVNDLLTVDSADRTIISVQRIWSGAQVALWRVGTRS